MAERRRIDVPNVGQCCVPAGGAAALLIEVRRGESQLAKYERRATFSNLFGVLVDVRRLRSSLLHQASHHLTEGPLDVGAKSKQRPIKL